jgi:hypothetical protein
MDRILRLSISLVLATMTILMVGCAGVAPNYSPSIDNVELLKAAKIPASKLGKITVKADMPGSRSIALRAASIASPVGIDFGDYLAYALRQELELAKLYDSNASAEISGTLLRNNIDAGGLATNSGQMQARFVVKRGGAVVFDKTKQIEHRWESAFAGAVAIPLAANNYVVMVQKLISSLVSDSDFAQALRR